ncbi:hypothetical protein B0H19DRAFT_1232212 [Mycena capillaripes]|nr:hypothetical protein B0H19DRAFT_1232212 [Mycena capillaripes]
MASFEGMRDVRDLRWLELAAHKVCMPVTAPAIQSAGFMMSTSGPRLSRRLIQGITRAEPVWHGYWLGIIPSKFGQYSANTPRIGRILVASSKCIGILFNMPEIAGPNSQTGPPWWSHLGEHRRDAVKDLLGSLSCMSKGYLRGPPPPGGVLSLISHRPHLAIIAASAGGLSAADTCAAPSCINYFSLFWAAP